MIRRIIIDLNITLYPTQDAFVFSPAMINVLVGPGGEGKTFGFVASIFNHARKNMDGVKGDCKVAIIRDSHANIRRMTAYSIQKALGFTPQWKDDYKRLLLPGIDIDLIGIGDLGGLTRLQGGEYSHIILEEPAPIIGSESINAGLKVEVYFIALTRCHRQEGCIPRLDVTMNPADKTHWSYRYFIKDPIRDVEGFPNMKTAVFNIPYGENKHQTALSRELTKQGLKSDSALYDRFVRGEWAFRPIGKSVVGNSYSQREHVADEKLNPIPGVRCIMGWDGGLNPTCVIMQVTPAGQLNILDCWVGDGVGMKQWAPHVKMQMAGRYDGINDWYATGDPSLDYRSQNDSSKTAADYFRETFQLPFEKGVEGWPPRRDSSKNALEHIVNGKRFVQLSPHISELDLAWSGGWHYKLSPTGIVVGGDEGKPEKDIHSHPADSASYIFERLLRGLGKKKRRAEKPYCDEKGRSSITGM